MKSPAPVKDDYEVITGFWDRGQFRSQGEVLRMSAAQAQTHVLAGCIKKVSQPVQTPLEAPSNAG